MSRLEGISVVVCTYNGRDRIAPTLEHLRAQVIPPDFEWELIVIDNACTDGTWSACEQLLVNFPTPWRVIAEPNPGLTHARWAGIREARHELVLFCDDDNWLAADYLATCSQVMSSDPSIGALGGRGEAVLEGEKPAWFDRFSHSYAVGPQGRKSGAKRRGSVYGAAATFRREALLRLSARGFESVLADRNGGLLSSGGDTELCFAIQLLGYQVWYDERLRFRHAIPSSRLDWSYYLKLKRGIAGSFPMIEAYRYHLRSEQPTLAGFRRHLRRKGWQLAKGWALVSVVRHIRPESDRLKLEIARATIPIKLKNLLSQWRTALAAYRRLELLRSK